MTDNMPNEIWITGNDYDGYHTVNEDGYNTRYIRADRPTNNEGLPLLDDIKNYIEGSDCLGLISKETALHAEQKLRQALSKPQEVDVERLTDNYNHVWKWVERLLFSPELKESALSCLKHSPYAPWNDESVDWDTSHKSYDDEIKALKDTLVIKKSELDEINDLVFASTLDSEELALRIGDIINSIKDRLRGS